MVAVGILYKRNSDYRRRMSAQMRLAQLGEAARTLAHEIKNPLGAIRIQTGFLRKTLPADRVRDLTLIEQEVDRLSSLADRVGSFLRDPVGRQEKIDLVRFLARFAEPGRVTLRVEGENSIYVLFDPERLRSVIENLVRNALDSHQETGVDDAVEIEVGHIQHLVRVVVGDRGPGINETDREKLFDPFYTTKTSGSGVGLPLVRRFVDAAGGAVVLRPRAEGGTEAIVTIREARS
jgi:two-component system sensor histidine kinase HydH